MLYVTPEEAGTPVPTPAHSGFAGTLPYKILDTKEYKPNRIITDMNKKINNKVERKSHSSFLLDNSLQMFKENLTSIVLFGSQARKEHNNTSDVDVILVTTRDNNQDVSKLRKKFLLTFKKRLDLHIFTREEVVQNFNNNSPLFTTLLLGINIVYDKENFFRKQFNFFIKQMSDSDIKYCEGNQIWEMKKVARGLGILR